MGSRRRSREVAVQVLYQADMVQKDITEAFKVFCDHFDAPAAVRAFAVELVNGVDRHMVEIDGLIRKFSEHWRLERMPVVDRSILRLAVFELLHRSDIPASVSINEAVDLGKKFGSEDSGAFINGILDRIRLHMEEKDAGESLPASDPELDQAGDPAG
ncbi:MAG: transcription antitermination factor NusB [Deltaproteobacteria bacterium]|nr:MAG: transcription antitermination factor NusB [Deltaproteobacteria bacterium]